jgi:hypothetical protein
VSDHKELMQRIGTVSQEIMGMPTARAIETIEAAGLRARVVRVDGVSRMITADCKQDRLGLITNGGLVTGIRYG